MTDGLPKIPGYSFNDPCQTKFSISHKFDFVNGYRYPRPNPIGIGKKELDVNSVGFLKKEDACRYDPTLTYGRAKTDVLPQFVPYYVRYDGKCLTFNAFLRQSVTDSPYEHYRLRQVNIIYFLDDDTITVIEPRIPNCGIHQGRFLNRGKIPRQEGGKFWHWKDFNVGMDVNLYGHVFHTVDCDLFTREYMQSQGLDMNPPEDMPPDPFMQNRLMAMGSKQRKTPLVDDKLRRYLEYEGKILRFDCVWDDRESEGGELRDHILYYFLEDDTVQLKEVRKKNDGRDPFPMVLKRTKIPKDWKRTPIDHPSCYFVLKPTEVNEYYQPKDFAVGETVFILGRRLLLTDCDPFTRNYYKQALNIVQKEPIDASPPPPPPVQKQVPPHVSHLGSVEDSLQLYFRLIPKRPKIDVVKQLANQGKTLRYTAQLVSSHPEDSIRKFMISYALNDGTIKVYEPVIRNSGIWGGKFLRQELVPKPGSDPNCPQFYTPADLYIGAVVDIHKHMFRITGADLYVYRYIMDNKDKFPQEVIANMRNYMYKQGHLEQDLEVQMEQNAQDEKQAEIDAIGSKDNKILSPTEICINAFKVPEERHPPRESIFADELSIIDRKDPVDTPSHQPVGIMRPMKDARYQAHPAVIEKRPCGAIRKAPEPPCCMREDCPQKSEYSDDAEKERLFREYLAQRHHEACRNIGDVYSRPCPKEETPGRSCHRLGGGDSPVPARKVVSFADNPMDPCAFNQDDVCQLGVKKTHANCTYYDQQ